MVRFFPTFLHAEYRRELTEQEDRGLDRGDGAVIEPFGETEEARGLDAAETSRQRTVYNEYYRLDRLTGPKQAVQRHHRLKLREQWLKYRREEILPDIVSKDDVRSAIDVINGCKQQYPVHEDDPWLTAGSALFDQGWVEDQKEACEKRAVAVSMAVPRPRYPRWDDPLTKTTKLIEKPDAAGDYLILYDQSEGDEAGDPFAGAVWNWTTLSLAAGMYGHGLDPEEQIIQLIRLGEFYLTDGAPSLIVPQRGPEGMHSILLLETVHGYQNVYYPSAGVASAETKKPGFPMNRGTRPFVIKALFKFYAMLREGKCRVDFAPFFAEMMGFQRNERTGKIEHAHGFHDDMLLNMGIATIIGVDEGKIDFPGADDFRRMRIASIEDDGKRAVEEKEDSPTGMSDPLARRKARRAAEDAEMARGGVDPLIARLREKREDEDAGRRARSIDFAVDWEREDARTVAA